MTLKLKRLGIKARIKRPFDIARFLYAQRVQGFTVPNEPHFDPLSTAPFVERLRASKLYLEFGSGGSTVVAAQLGVETVTVENDRFFARSVQKKIGPQADNTMLVIDLGFTLEWGFPVFREKTPERLSQWADYIEAPLRYIATLGGRFPDLVLVDGRFRRACALACAREASRLGVQTTICVDDYADREWYHSLEQVLGQPDMIGRMAIFAIDLALTPPSGTDLAEALQDFR